VKLCRYYSPDGPKLGVAYGEQVLDAVALFDHAGERAPDVVLQADIKTICAAPDSVVVFLADLLNHGKLDTAAPGLAQPATGVRFLPPVPRPEKFICIGLNYQDHCDEQNKPRPERPILFGKYANAIVGHEDNVIYSRVTHQLDYEGELGVVIGAGGKGIARDAAMDHVFGYTIINDISARDVQKTDGQFLRAKTQDTFAPMGPWVVTTHEVTDPQNLAIRTRVNGTLLQDSNTRHMIFGVAELIEFISHGITLEPGDVISTGTPAGVGVHRKPQALLQVGDVVEVEIEGIGLLRNRVVAG